MRLTANPLDSRSTRETDRSGSANGTEVMGSQGDDWILINNALNRFPQQARPRLRESLLRTDVVVSKKDDPDAQRLLHQIYERRRLRLNEAFGPESK